MTNLNYMQDRTIYYSLFVSELTGKPLSDVFNLISPIFLCESDRALNSLMEDSKRAPTETYNNISIYINFIHSFCTDKQLFGMQKAERAFLEIKHDILLLVEELNKYPFSNELIVLSERYKEMNLSTAYALTLYCLNADSANQFIPVLRKALRDVDGLDAGVALLYFEKTDKKQDCLRVVAKQKGMDLYPGLLATLASHYGLDAASATKRDFMEVKQDA